MKSNSYIYNVLIALDQMANAILGGHCEETLSSRCGRSYLFERKPLFFVHFLYNIINAIMINRNHCRDCIEWDKLELIEENEPWHWYKKG